MIKFRCPQCDQKLGVPDEYAGKRVRCSKCSQPCQVPAASVQPQPAAAAPQKPASIQQPARPAAAAKQPSAATPQVAKSRPAAAPKPAPVPAVQEEIDDIPMEEETNPFAGLQFDNSPGDANREAIAAARQIRNKEHARVSGKSSKSGSGPKDRVSASGVALGAGKVPLAVVASISFILAICIAWTFIEWFTGGLFLLDYLFPFGIAAAGASGLVMFTEKRNFALGALAAILALGGIVTAKVMIAKWVVMADERVFADLSWDEQRSLMDDPGVVYGVGTMVLWEDGQLDATIAKSLIMAKAEEVSDEYSDEFYEEEGEEGEGEDMSSDESAEDESGENAMAAAADANNMTAQAAPVSPPASDEASPREYETEHQAVSALVEKWTFQEKQKAFEQHYDKYQKCTMDWFLITPIGFIVALLMTFSCWDLVVIPASLVMAFKMGIGSDA